MEIRNSMTEDIDTILEFYAEAISFQKEKGSVQWPEFEPMFIETEIKEGRQWKMVSGEDIACVWVTTFDDPQIWEEKNSDPSVYIHRIAVNSHYRGNNLVLELVEWAKKYAHLNGKKFIRMDTVGENHGLINHYKKCGFDFLGLYKLKNTRGLPAHYDNATVSLFEISLS
jgi:ribosomal protein S18 acetylase RimI-like enzyme